MQGLKKRLIFLTLGIISTFSFQTLKINAGSFGAEIFCSMREGGNDHESSWEAAYSYIKKQKGGIFKVSPKQGKNRKRLEKELEEANDEFSEETIERYSY